MRVVAGQLRGRRLISAAGKTRPTMARARAGLFDWLGTVVMGARVLDLYAGSGALGIEALSRGALEAVFVERARPALKALGRNLDELGLRDQAAVVAVDVGRALASLARDGRRFDLVLADPPYGGDWLERPATAANLVNLLPAEGVFIAERSRREAPGKSAPGLVLRETRSYGETAFDWYEKSGDVSE